jgi:uncharacterized repeat protein (TIGR03803 family)
MKSSKNILRCTDLPKFSLIILILFSSLVTSGQEMLFGLTSEGGNDGIGALYKANADGSELQVKQSFGSLTPGRLPAEGKLVQAANGKFYGTTQSGGKYLQGVIFEYDAAANQYRRLHDFDGTSGGYPIQNMVDGFNGKLYGLTFEGGQFNQGVIFEFDITTSSYAVKYEFDGQSGANPWAMTYSEKGHFYGATNAGGVSNNGVIFKFDPKNNLYTKKIDIDATIGSRPLGSLTFGSTGKMYGTVSEGGAHSNGAIFEYDSATNVIAKRYDFNGSSGDVPTGNLLSANNGKLYGMTISGGTTGNGVIFEFDPLNRSFTKKIDFDGGAKGAHPYGSLIQASNGKIYGTVEQGVTGYGGLFEYNITSSNFNMLITFSGSRDGYGSSPRTTLMEATDGKLYGATRIGGLNFDGNLFSFDPASGSVESKLSFGYGDQGSFPIGGIAQGANGRIYGMTYEGGEQRSGTLFEYDLSHDVMTKKYEFNLEHGAHAGGTLVLATNGKLYGLTWFGGQSNSGVIFEYTPSTNSYVKKKDFGSDMGSPRGAMVQASNGKFYGTSVANATGNKGSLFEYDDDTNLLTKKITFNGSDQGGLPTGTLLHDGDKLYGLTYEGGSQGKGTLFEYNILTGILTTLKNFGPGAGENPVGSLIKAKNNKFYGVTSRGGAFQFGVIFEFDPANNTLTKLHDFSNDAQNGIDIQSSLVESSNGKLYGTTAQGGKFNKGAMYEFDVATNTFIKKADFMGANGARPAEQGPLLFVSMQDQSVEFDANTEKTFGDEPFALNATASSGLSNFTYTTSDPSIASIQGNMVTIHSAGVVTITATQEGGVHYHPASSEQTITIWKASQEITFGPLQEETTLTQKFPLIASSTSGLAVSFASDNPDIVTISGDHAIIKGAGTVTITASQTGDNRYLAAEEVSQSLVILLVLGQESAQDISLKIYPHPAQSQFFVECGKQMKESNIELFDAHGNFVKISAERIDSNTLLFHSENLNDGLYLMRYNGRATSEKIIIRH